MALVLCEQDHFMIEELTSLDANSGSSQPPFTLVEVVVLCHTWCTTTTATNYARAAVITHKDSDMIQRKIGIKAWK